MDIYQQLAFNKKSRVSLKTNINPQELIQELNLLKKKEFLARAKIDDLSLTNLNNVYGIKCFRKNGNSFYDFLYSTNHQNENENTLKIMETSSVLKQELEQENEIKIILNQLLQDVKSLNKKMVGLEEKIETFQIKVEQKEEKSYTEEFPAYNENFPDLSKNTSIYINIFLYERFLSVLKKKNLKKYSILNQLIFNFLIENEEKDMI